MNHSSLFSFEESSVWDPKVIMKRLIVPEDQLIKLNSMPGKHSSLIICKTSD